MADQPYVLRHNDLARYDIPAPLAREIGRFIVTWANFENYVQTIIWGTLDLAHGEGRIAVREPRIVERLDMLRDLAEFRNFAVDFVLLKEIRKRAEHLAGKRHLLAHCIWQRPSSYWIALITRGSWSETQLDIADYPQGSKNFEPEAIEIGVADVRAWTEETIALIGDVEKLGDNPRPVPLPEKRKPRPAPKRQKKDRTGSGHRPRRPA